MIKYIILHNTHNGCYDFQYYEDEKARLRLTSITINPPKIFLFNDREAAQDFFEEYINDCLLYTSPSPRDRQKSRMPSSA